MEEYSTFIETLKKMFTDKKIEISKVRALLTEKKITSEEYEYIIKR